MRRLSILLAAAGLCLAAFAPLARAEEFGVEAGSFSAGSYQGDGAGILGAGASPDARAGGHPFQASTNFTLNHHDYLENTYPDGGGPRNIVVHLPAGFIGNPQATPQCSQVTLNLKASCPNDTAIGVAHLNFRLNFGGPGGPELNNRSYFLPVYNMVPSLGEPALFGFYVPNPSMPVFIHLRLDPVRSYAVSASVSNISTIGLTWRSELTIWGVPADPSHDPFRGWRGEVTEKKGPGCVETFTGPSGETCPSDAPLRPLLTDPTQCSGAPQQTGLSVDSWLLPGRLDQEGEPDLADPVWSSAAAQAPALTGCAALKFGGGEAPASLSLQPISSHAADTPSAYQAKLILPYNENPGALANPTLRDATVTLPRGVAVNPSSANGLGACSTAQIGLTSAIGVSPIRFDGQPAHCPDAAKIGTVTASTPLLDHPIEGTVYLAAQEDNPFASLLAIYIVLEDPQTGTVVKLAGKVSPDSQTGQLTATFTENPQLPVTELDLRFFGGPHASLLNPSTCGRYTTTSVLTPWSAPYTPAVTSTDSFQVTAGANDTPCASSEAQLPNRPSFEAGTVSPLAGAYSPFVMHLARADGDQRIQGLELKLPPGLTGRLAGIPYCSEQAIAAAESRSGRAESAQPDCSAASQLGTVDVGAGAGPDPVHVQGHAYLAGPYKGAPLSLVIVTPAAAGPFDLGTVVVRAAFRIDPETAKVTAISDPLPRILQGIPLDVRSIQVNLDRPDFTLNPTSCEPMSLLASASSPLGQSASLSSRFQVGGCAGLAFEPKLSLALRGATKRTGNPSLIANLSYPRGSEANVARAQVKLPTAAFLDNAHIGTVCTRVQFAANACPPRSVYGKASATSPLLDYPISGPVYLRSSPEHELPDLVAKLRGPDAQPVEIDLVGRTDSVKGALRNTFEAVPDVPASSFHLELFGGKRGLVELSRNLCAHRYRAVVKLKAQNGMSHDTKPTIANSCKHRAQR